MRSMGSPDYVYTPWSDSRRAKMAAIHRRRLGIPDGCSRLYGIHVPTEFANDIRDDAAWIANEIGWDAAQDFIRKVADIDWSLVEELYQEHTSYRQLAELCGVPSWYVEKRTRHLRRINPWRVEKRRHDR